MNVHMILLLHVPDWYEVTEELYTAKYRGEGQRMGDGRWEGGLEPESQSLVQSQAAGMATAVVKKGWFQKRGQPPFTDFKTRFFVLHGSDVRYWKSQDDHDAQAAPQGSFSCVDLEIAKDLELSHKHGFHFVLHTRDPTAVNNIKTIECACSTETERAEWLAAFEAATLQMSTKEGGSPKSPCSEDHRNHHAEMELSLVDFQFVVLSELRTFVYQQANLALNGLHAPTQPPTNARTHTHTRTQIHTYTHTVAYKDKFAQKHPRAKKQTLSHTHADTGCGDHMFATLALLKWILMRLDDKVLQLRVDCITRNQTSGDESLAHEMPALLQGAVWKQARQDAHEPIEEEETAVSGQGALHLEPPSLRGMGTNVTLVCDMVQCVGNSHDSSPIVTSVDGGGRQVLEIPELDLVHVSGLRFGGGDDGEGRIGEKAEAQARSNAHEGVSRGDDGCDGKAYWKLVASVQGLTDKYASNNNSLHALEQQLLVCCNSLRAKHDVPEVQMLPSDPSSTVRSTVMQEMFDLWDAYGEFLRFPAMMIIVLAVSHNSVLGWMHVQYRHRIAYEELLSLSAANVICLLCMSRLYFWTSLGPERQRWYLQLFMSSYVVCLCLGVFISSLPGRTSTMASLNATLFCMCSFFLFKGCLLKAVFNFPPCFSWHFWKIALPWLEVERGSNLLHLLYLVFIYFLSIYLSTTCARRQMRKFLNPIWTDLGLLRCVRAAVVT